MLKRALLVSLLFVNSVVGQGVTQKIRNGKLETNIDFAGFKATNVGSTGGLNVTVDSNGTVINVLPTNYPTGQLLVNNVPVTPGGVTPTNTAITTSQWLNSYNSASGVFGKSQPNFADLLGSAAIEQIPTGTNGTTVALGNHTHSGVYQPFDSDLTSLAAVTGTNTIYYRSAANTWSPITIGGNLTFSAGTLSVPDAAGEADPIISALYVDSGDLVTTDGASLITLTVGANNTFLIADNGQTGGLKWAGTTVARGALGLGTAATANTGTSGANLPFLNAANTWTVGQTQTFGANATNPGFRFIGVASDPSTLSEGAHWYRTDIHKLRVHNGTAARSVIVDSDFGTGVATALAVNVGSVGSFLTNDGAYTAYSPTVAPFSGTITTLGTVSAAYQQLGKTVLIRLSIPITTNGTGGGYITVTLPSGLNGKTGVSFPMAGLEDNSTGGTLIANISSADTTKIRIFKASDNSYPGGSGFILRVSGHYETN